MPRRFAIAASFLFALTAPLSAGDGKHGFLSRVHKGKDGESKYVLFVPHDYKGDKEAPLILFLHGAGERGADGEAPVKQGIGNAIKFKGAEAKFPFFVIFPQCQPKSNWKAGTPDADRALAILNEVMKDYRIDGKRLYLTGLSMGGSGTWSLAAAYPGKWAAIAPICGGADLSTASAIKDIPCWAFCGDKDRPDLVKNMREMVGSLKKASGEPRYTELPHVGHNSWDPAYVTPELYSWFLSHKTK